MVAFLNQVFSCLSLPCPEGRPSPLTEHTHNKGILALNISFCCRVGGNGQFYSMSTDCGATALEVHAGVNVNFKPVLNMTHLRFLGQEIISHCTVYRRILFPVYLSPSFLLFFPLSPLFFFCCLRERSEGAAGGSPKGHSVKWTQLWPPRHPRHSQSDHFSPTHRPL